MIVWEDWSQTCDENAPEGSANQRVDQKGNINPTVACLSPPIRLPSAVSSLPRTGSPWHPLTISKRSAARHSRPITSQGKLRSRLSRGVSAETEGCVACFIHSPLYGTGQTSGNRLYGMMVGYDAAGSSYRMEGSYQATGRRRSVDLLSLLGKGRTDVEVGRVMSTCGG